MKFQKTNKAGTRSVCNLPFTSLRPNDSTDRIYSPSRRLFDLLPRASARACPTAVCFYFNNFLPDSPLSALVLLRESQSAGNTDDHHYSTPRPPHVAPLFATVVLLRLLQHRDTTTSVTVTRSTTARCQRWPWKGHTQLFTDGENRWQRR